MSEYRVLWTGGWDSTFMLIKVLSNIQLGGGYVVPVYILDRDRGSYKYELKAMDSIHKMLKDRSFPNILADIVIIHKEDIPANENLTAVSKRCSLRYRLGSQYDWLSRYAESTGGLVCLGLENGPRSIAISSMDVEGVSFINTSLGKIVNANSGKSDLTEIFSHFVFPIIDDSEISMKNWVRENDFEDVMSHIWFCHDPIGGEPCGLCNPCLEKYGSGMGYLLSHKAIGRTKVLVKVERIMGVRVRKKLASIWRRIITH